MKQKAVICVLAGQLCLFFFIFVCFLLIPHFLLESNEGGVSNYGLYAKTIVPYTLAFGSCSVLTILAVSYLPKKITVYRSLKRTLTALGFLYMAVLVSTYSYKVNHVFDDIHLFVATLLVVLQLLLGSWFALKITRNHVNVLIYITQLGCFLAAILNYYGKLHALFVIELLAGLVFATLLIRTLKQLSDETTSLT